MSVSAVACFDHSHFDEASALSRRCAVPLINAVTQKHAKAKELRSFFSSKLGPDPCLILCIDASGLCLYASGELNSSIRANFHSRTATYRRRQGGGRGQMIAKAVGLKHGINPTVLDCTAGLGRDAFVLAGLGCRVTLLERSVPVALLLKDGIEQARVFAQAQDPELLEILQRMRVVEAEARDYLSTLAHERPDVIYLDPMFPLRIKSAQVKKEMQVFHKLVGRDLDSDILLEAARRVAVSRVVVKRPRIAPTLEGPEPSHVLEGKSTRYDIYLPT
ncbi:MAG: class I SAM-dependent methyltransferase [Verrucomicrobiota bacterium]